MFVSREPSAGGGARSSRRGRPRRRSRAPATVRPGPRMSSTKTPQTLGAPVGEVADRQLDLLAGVRRQVDAPLLPAGAVAGGRVPRARRAGRRAVRALVVLHERVDLDPAFGAPVAGARRRVAVGVRERGPVVGADRCASTATSPSRARCHRTSGAQLAGRRPGEVDRAGQPLPALVGPLAEHVPVARVAGRTARRPGRSHCIGARWRTAGSRPPAGSSRSPATRPCGPGCRPTRRR